MANPTSSSEETTENPSAEGETAPAKRTRGVRSRGGAGSRSRKKAAAPVETGPESEPQPAPAQPRSDAPSPAPETPVTSEARAAKRSGDFDAVHDRTAATQERENRSAEIPERTERTDSPDREDEDRERMDASAEPPAPTDLSPAIDGEGEERDSGQPGRDGGADRPQHQGGGHSGGSPGGGGGPSGGNQGGPGGGNQGGPGGGFWKQGKKNKKKGKFFPGGGGWQGNRPPSGPPQPPPPEFATVTGTLPDAARFADLAALDAKALELASGTEAPLFLDELAPKTQAQLVAFAREHGVTFEGVPTKHQALMKLIEHAAAQKRPVIDRGWLDLTDRGYGFVVHAHDNMRLYPDDTYVPESLVQRYGLKRGHHLEVLVQPAADGERCPAAVQIRTVMGGPPEAIAKVTPFEELVPYYPLKRILLEVPERDAGSKDVSMRLVDIITPIGFGQRGLIVAPPRTGKTVLLHNIANSISANFPEYRLLILLVDERPEEVTDFKRHTKGEVISSTFDESPENHVHAAEMVGERARRLVEQGEHVIILLDSITRLARAYNALASNSGKIMTGGMEATALQKPKRFFGAARNIEGGGSLTVLGTALIDTGSKMDEVIFEEFKGTGNMELHLDRDLVNKRIFPAVNIDKSGTRKEELIYHPDEMNRIYSLRRAMQGIPPVEAMEMLIQRLRKTKTNAEFLMGLNR